MLGERALTARALRRRTHHRKPQLFTCAPTYITASLGRLPSIRSLELDLKSRGGLVRRGCACLHPPRQFRERVKVDILGFDKCQPPFRVHAV